MSLRYPIVGPDVRVWANDMRRFLARQWDRLTFKTDGTAATDDGVILWDAENGYPVVSKGGDFRQVVIVEGVYADNAAATSAGLSAGHGYQTATGELRVVV